MSDELKESISSLLASMVVILLDSLFIFWAWNGFAWKFNLPIFSYWHWVVTLMAFRAFFPSNKNKGK